MVIIIMIIIDRMKPDNRLEAIFRGRVLSGKVGTGRCGPDTPMIGCLFVLLGLSMTPFLFENLFSYRSRFCKMLNFR